MAGKRLELKKDKERRGIMADLRLEYAGMEFKNPVAAVAGPLGRTYEALKRSIEAGCGAVTLKSNNVKAKEPGKRRSSHEAPVKPAHIFLGKYGLKQSMINWEGVPTDFTAEDERDLILKIKPLAQKHGARIIANIHPDPAYMEDMEMYREDIRTILSAEPDLLEVVPCGYHFPQVAYLEKGYGQVAELLKPAYETALEEANIPVIVKLPQPLLFLLANTLRQLGITTLHVCEGPHFHGTVVDIETMKPLCPGPSVYTYGRHRRLIMNLQTARVKALGGDEVELISSSGVWTTEDCIERMMCGSHLVGLHTAIQYHGHGLFTKIIDGISAFLDRKGLSLKQVIGAAVAEIVSEEVHEEFMEECDLTSDQIWPEIDLDKCNGCGICANCIHGGISMEADRPKTHLDLCMRCGVCESICPVDGIQMARA
jgi:dihydroorotate dehydrogenase/Pyruvate/2-oxoacid:ferredoxin oxidoreductase delta subunit